MPLACSWGAKSKQFSCADTSHSLELEVEESPDVDDSRALYAGGCSNDTAASDTLSDIYGRANSFFDGTWSVSVSPCDISWAPIHAATFCRDALLLLMLLLVVVLMRSDECVNVSLNAERYSSLQSARSSFKNMIVADGVGSILFSVHVVVFRWLEASTTPLAGFLTLAVSLLSLTHVGLWPPTRSSRYKLLDEVGKGTSCDTDRDVVAADWEILNSFSKRFKDSFKVNSRMVDSEYLSERECV